MPLVPAVLYHVPAEFVLLHKDKHEPLIREEELVKYQDPVNTLLRKKFLTRILDYMDQLGWEPYQVTGILLYLGTLCAGTGLETKLVCSDKAEHDC